MFELEIGSSAGSFDSGHLAEYNNGLWQITLITFLCFHGTFHHLCKLILPKKLNQADPSARSLLGKFCSAKPLVLAQPCSTLYPLNDTANQSSGWAGLGVLVSSVF